MVYRRKVDSNQAEIVSLIRSVPGVSVFDVSRFGHGLPDLIVGFRGVNYLVEVKSERGDLTDAERDFFNDWQGQAAIARTVDDLLQIIGIDP